jgi:hypothetical protein
LSYSQSTTDQRNPYGQGEGRGQSQGKGSTSDAKHYPGWGVQGKGEDELTLVVELTQPRIG